MPENKEPKKYVDIILCKGKFDFLETEVNGEIEYRRLEAKGILIFRKEVNHEKQD